MIRAEQITLCPVTQADDPFLLSVYASTRINELAQVPWTPEQKQAILNLQFTAQKQHYAAEYPQASHEMISVDGRPVGRIYLNRGREELHILDITILPEYRNQGIGSLLVGRLLDEARRAAKPLTIYVESFNPSLYLFERLGFRPDHEKGFHLLMKWTARSQPGL